MKLLEDKILTDGVVKPGNILKVDNFLNHQIDVAFLNEIGSEFARLFGDKKINKIMTIEASGIGIATIVAQHFDNVPVLFAKKAKSANIGDDLYTSVVKSYTYGKDYTITVSKKFLSTDDRVLILDDFMAMGSAMNGLIDIINQAGASIEGIGICIEKGFQPGGQSLRDRGYNVQSLAIIDNMDNGVITFREQ
ncbi:MAG: xanthine phosphoribosyltransferase [Oscillospiraceae bacterium]|nr:xanthine phosphoribosyltransferase [Oscillospiraceae bacterium]